MMIVLMMDYYWLIITKEGGRKKPNDFLGPSKNRLCGGWSESAGRGLFLAVAARSD
jgi:hypothetical protein